MSTREVPSPDGKWIATPGPRNTVVIIEAETRLYWGTYYGHQAGVYRRETGHIVSLEWKEEEEQKGVFYIVSESSDGSKQEWYAPSCLHRRSLTEAHGY